jgi:alpha-L-arabinofuranosidase B-like protein
MRRIAFIAALLVAWPALAQMPWQSGVGTPVTAAGYTGPGDTKSGANEFWGVIAYTNALIGNNLFELQRASDNTKQTIVSVAGGGPDTATATTFCAATTCGFSKFYGQVNGQDCVQATQANETVYTASASGTLPGSTQTGVEGCAANIVTLLTEPYTIILAGKRTATGLKNIITGVSGNRYLMLGTTSADTWSFAADTITTPTLTATDNAFHAVQIIYNSTTSNATVDGSTGSNQDAHTGSLGSNQNLALGTNSTGVNAADAVVLFWGLWPVGFTGGELTSMNSTMHTVGQF